MPDPRQRPGARHDRLENYEREDAFGEAEVRLLDTVAASMGVALENARLFDETQRLLKETEQRNAELAIINSMQAGLAAELDFQGDLSTLVGDKIREVFGNRRHRHPLVRCQRPICSTTCTSTSTASASTLAPEPPGDRRFAGARRRARGDAGRQRAHGRGMRRGTAAARCPGTGRSKSSRRSSRSSAATGCSALIALENCEREHAFGEADVRLLQTVANSMSVALENARLFDETQRLLKESEQRAAELAIINSVQEALAAELNIQGIYDAVGDKIREIFDNADVGIRIYDPQTESGPLPVRLRGRQADRDRVACRFRRRGFGRARPAHPRDARRQREHGGGDRRSTAASLLPGTRLEKSVVFVPLVAGDQVARLIDLIDMEREHAFSESDVRLLQTLANSMSVALENARLFDETQRLFKESEQRAAELAIINSVQQALAAELDMQGIYRRSSATRSARSSTRRTCRIALYDPAHEHACTARTTYEHGKRIAIAPHPLRRRASPRT